MNRSSGETLRRWGATLIALAAIYVALVYAEAGVTSGGDIAAAWADWTRPWTLEGEAWTTVIFRLVASLKLYAVALAGVCGFGLPLGVFSGGIRYAVARKGFAVVFLVLISIPTLWMAFASIYYAVEALQVPVLRTAALERAAAEGGIVHRWLGDLWFVLLPAAVLAVPGIGKVALDVRAAIAANMSSRTMIALAARGLSRSRRLYRYALPASWWSSLRAVADVLPIMAGASMIVEKVFDYPGLGARCFDAVVAGDFRLLLMLAMMLALLVLVGRMVLELLEAVVFRERRGAS